MINKNKGFIISLAILAVLAMYPIALPSALTIKDEKSEYFMTFPLLISEWQGVETPPNERDLEILETRNVLSREYTDSSGNKIHLLLVSSQHDRRVAHPPEVCFLGSNYNIFKERETSLDQPGGAVQVKEFQAVYERDHSIEQNVMYLYKVGDKFTTNYYAQQIQFAFDRLKKKSTEVLLIRVAGASQDAVKKFMIELLPVLQ